MKQLHPTELYAIEVPKNAERYLFSLYGNVFFTYDVAHKRHSVDLKSKNDFEILGEVTADEILFDIDSVNRMMIDAKFIDVPMFSGGSFRSLLSANGLLFLNPITKPDCDCLTEYDREGCPDECWKFINKQNNLIKGKLIILKKL